MWMRFADPGPPPDPSEAPPPTAPPGGEGGDDASAGYGQEVHETLLAMLPWAVSGLMHVGLIILALFVVWSIVAAPQDEDVIVPVVDLSPTPGTPLQVQRTKTTKTSQTSRRSLVQTHSQSTARSLSSKVAVSDSLIGVSGLSGSKSPFNGAGAGQASFHTSFFGSGGNARRIAFLVDASGSLIDTLPFVIDELNKSIQKLSDQQKFTVIFFQGDKALEVPPPGLKPATAANKAKVINYIKPSANHILAQGGTNPLNALRLALRYKPQLIFLLSDNITGNGRYQLDQRRLLSAINKANISGTKINTIQFLYPDPLSKLGLKGTMRQIADASGGVYKFINSEQLDYNYEQR